MQKRKISFSVLFSLSVQFLCHTPSPTGSLDILALDRNAHNHAELWVVELDVHCDTEVDARCGHQPSSHGGRVHIDRVAEDRKWDPQVSEDRKQAGHQAKVPHEKDERCESVEIEQLRGEIRWGWGYEEGRKVDAGIDYRRRRGTILSQPRSPAWAYLLALSTARHRRGKCSQSAATQM